MMSAAALLPSGLNASALLAMIHSLTPVDKETLFTQLGMNSEDIRQLVGEALGSGQVVPPLLLNPLPPAAGADNARLMQYPEYRAHKLLRLYIPPVLLLLGTFGNIFSFLILRHKAMARQSTHHFLAALAVVDSLVLYVGLFRQWLGDLTGFDPQLQSVWLCKTIVTLGYSCSNVSVWIIVAVTVERYIVVCHPLKATLVCNVSRAKRVVLAITALFVLINLHFLWTTSLTWQHSGGPGGQPHSPQCNSQEGHEFLITEVWPWVDAVLYGFGPFVIIFVLNVFIIVRVIRATSGRVSLQSRFSGVVVGGGGGGCGVGGGCLALIAHNAGGGGGGGGRGVNNNNNNNPHTPQRRRRFATHTNLRLTVMLLVVSFTFLLTTLPMNVSVIASAFWNSHSTEDLARMSRFQLVFTVAELLMYLNHSVNFFLYCATGHKFRSEMIRMVCGKQRPSAMISDHSQHLYCSRNCVVNGVGGEVRNLEETEL
ncbi:hypothetical protein ACOMHN_010370 [Nucella lapillus]